MLGQSYTDLEVSSTGQAWLTARISDHSGAWTVLDGAPRWHRLDSTESRFRGPLAPRPDGGMWILQDDQVVVRVNPDASSRTMPWGATSPPSRS